MENRIALIGIMIEDSVAVERVNSLLHEYAPYIIGRMGIPYRDRNINIISVALDAPNDAISALTGKLGMLSGVRAKALYQK